MTHVRSRPPFEGTRRSARPKLRPDVVAVVFIGGCVGGALRYLATSASRAPAGGFPWATLGVNVAGAFVLGLVVVIAADVVPSRYLRPLVGTGFCGGLTTFSSVVVAVDRMLADHRAGTAVLYLLATVLAGLGAAALGVLLGRAVAAGHRRIRRERSIS